VVAATQVAVAVVTLVAAATEALEHRGYRRAEIRRDIESNRIESNICPQSAVPSPHMSDAALRHAHSMTRHRS